MEYIKRQYNKKNGLYWWCFTCYSNIRIRILRPIRTKIYNILSLLLAYKSLTVSMDKMSASHCDIQFGNRSVSHFTHCTSMAFCLFIFGENVWYLACSHSLFYLKIFYIVQNINRRVGKSDRKSGRARRRGRDSEKFNLSPILWFTYVLSSLYEAHNSRFLLRKE